MQPKVNQKITSNFSIKACFNDANILTSNN